MGDLTDEQEIIRHFQQLTNDTQRLAAQVNDLVSESQEHASVIKALEPMDGDRKCFRLVGDVLVERTVKEVTPAVKSNKEQLDQVVEKLRAQLKAKRQELSEFEAKYKIRVKGSNEPPSEAAGSTPASQGVLVSKH